MGARYRRAFGHVPAPEGVCSPGSLRVGLTGVDGRPRPRMHNQVGPKLGQGPEHHVPVADVKTGPIGRHHLVMRVFRSHAGQVGPQLTGSPRDQYLHGRFPARDLNGCHHHRLSRYQLKVPSRASSSDRLGSHPRARTLDESTA
jgi:hypothetical protein